MQNIIVSFEPSHEQVEIIEKWLIKESKTSKAGFFVNWQNSVLVSHSRGLMAIALLHDSRIGFITWYKENERVAEIVITEIQPGFRKKGYGRSMVAALLTKLKNDAIYVVKLHCQPATSGKAWKKLGFIQFPKIDGFHDYNSPEGKHLYKSYIPMLNWLRRMQAMKSCSFWQPNLIRQTCYSQYAPGN